MDGTVKAGSHYFSTCGQLVIPFVVNISFLLTKKIDKIYIQ